MSLVTRKAAVLYLAAVFVAGAVAGGFAGYNYGRRPQRPSGPPKREDFVKGKCDRLARELDLTAAELAKIEPIVRETFERIGKLQKESTQRFMEAREESDRRIAEQLDPAKRTRFEEIQRERHKRWSHQPGGGGPGGAGGPPGPGGPPPAGQPPSGGGPVPPGRDHKPRP